MANFEAFRQVISSSINLSFLKCDVSNKMFTLFTIFSETEWRGFEGAENVKHLTTEDFHSEIKSNEHVLVMFYAPW